MVNRADRAPRQTLAIIDDSARLHCPVAPVFHCRTVPKDLVRLADQASVPLDALRSARVACFAGIANPQRFFDDVDSTGATVVASLSFSDHHRFDILDLERVGSAAVGAGADLILTTQKDAARLGSSVLPPSLSGLHAFGVTTVVDETDAFTSLLARSVA